MDNSQINYKSVPKEAVKKFLMGVYLRLKNTRGECYIGGAPKGNFLSRKHDEDWDAPIKGDPTTTKDKA